VDRGTEVWGLSYYNTEIMTVDHSGLHIIMDDIVIMTVDHSG